MFSTTRISGGAGAKILLFTLLAAALTGPQDANASAGEARCMDMRLRAEASRADPSGSESGLDSIRRSPGLILRKDPSDDSSNSRTYVSVSEFGVSAGEETSSQLMGIATDSDGVLAVADFAGHRILRFHGPTDIQTLSLDSGAAPAGMTTASDGIVWFADYNDRIGRIGGCGLVTEYSLPTVGSHPFRIVEGPDNALWFTEFDGNRIGRLTKEGELSEFPVPTEGSHPAGITVGRDGNLWFTESGANKIGRISLSGDIAEFAVLSPESQPLGIASGSDGALWFVEYAGNRVGSMTLGGAMREFPLPTARAKPSAIVAGQDGALWFTESGIGGLGRITVTGQLSEYWTPTAGSAPFDLLAESNGSIWFTEAGAGAVGYLRVVRRRPGKGQDDE